MSGSSEAYYVSWMWKRKKTRLGTVRLFEDSGGLKKQGRYYLYCGLLKELHQDPMVEVSLEVYQDYMRDVWRQEKVKERESKCWLGSKRCSANCDECKYDRVPSIDSIDRLYEEVGDWETGKEMII